MKQQNTVLMNYLEILSKINFIISLKFDCLKVVLHSLKLYNTTWINNTMRLLNLALLEHNIE